jgi:TfoX/Sxy family transcriptional regulator of competence genes
MVRDSRWNSDPKALQAVIKRLLDTDLDELDISFRPMFGGIMTYTMGRPFASLSNAGIALKLDPADRNTLIERGLGYPLRYEPSDTPSKSYTVLPESKFGSGEAELKHWLRLSIGYCRTLPVKPRRARC